jgi:hypothetical protein
VTRRAPVPALRRPSDVLFQGPAAPPPPAPAKNAQVTLYLPPAMLADLDAHRAALLRERGVRVDRSRMMRELLRGGLDSPWLLERLTREEEGHAPG